uniref:Enhancer of polycomb-like protein n=1 Tax=Parastrongyloides trichosuri TaxID=131310 RepID=A0A0N4ZU11_PARTI
MPRSSHKKSVKGALCSESKIKHKKKLSKKDFYNITLSMDKERKRRRSVYHEKQRKKIKKLKPHNSLKKKPSLTKVPDKKCKEEIVVEKCSLKETQNNLSPVFKEKIVEVKNNVDNKKIVIEKNCVKDLKYDEPNKKEIFESSNKLDETLEVPCKNNLDGIISSVSVSDKLEYTPIASPIAISTSIENLKIMDTPKNNFVDRSLEIRSFSLPATKKKKAFDSIEVSTTKLLTKTLDVSHPYATLNCRDDVMNSKLEYLHKNNYNNKWDIYDQAGIPFWVPKIDNDDENTDDSSSDIPPLDLSALIDVEQGKIELPEYIEEPHDLNPFQPLRVMINRNTKYFESKTIFLITLRSMATLHLKDIPSKSNDLENQSKNISSVEITDIRECISYQKYTPKSTFQCKYRGEVWPVKEVNPKDPYKIK